MAKPTSKSVTNQEERSTPPPTNIDGQTTGNFVEAASKPGMNKGEAPKTPQAVVVRETIESFAVALVLAFMFRAFVAEIFVIPTGSMAPTLMGAHKDIKAAETNFGYQCGTSFEFSNDTGKRTNEAAVATICPLSRKPELLDLANRPNHTTFSGDRIIVSKFSYLWQGPKRWDVIVFKYPYDARINYIKRCVGLPNETLRIEQGDIYTRPVAEKNFSIARKPPRIVEAMLQPVADTSYPASHAVQAGLPSAWQPYPEIGKGNLGWKLSEADQVFKNGWNVDQTESAWKASFTPDAEKKLQTEWLRYHHRVLSLRQWEILRTDKKLAVPIPRYSSRLISDFSHYNSAYYMDRRRLYDQNGKRDDSYRELWSITNPPHHLFKPYNYDDFSNYENDGRHWTGDLACEFEVNVGTGQGSVTLDLVEAGCHYLCQLNTQDGTATLTAVQDGANLNVFEAGNGKLVDRAVATTGFKSGKSHHLKYANVDDTLTLWLDGRVVEFSPSNRVVSDSDADMSKHHPQSTVNDPLDAAPVAIGAAGVSLQVQRAQVWRDVYYIAIKPTNYRLVTTDDPNLRAHIGLSMNSQVTDEYCKVFYPDLPVEAIGTRTAHQRDILFSTPALWQRSPVFQNRHYVELAMGDDQYLPMGDNSAASSDARGWTEPLPRRLMIGRAIAVFWPHVWMEPIPYLPNFSRMGLIR